MTEEIVYLGEHLLPGYLGRGALFLAFSTGLLATIAYFFATQRRANEAESNSWRKIGRWAFALHGLGVFVTIGTIFYVMINQYYEYQYVNAHVNADLPFKYLFSAFWEGQEGSFLLWMFWHVVLGGLLIGSAKEWESPVMSVVSSVQIVLGTMILGVYVGFGDWAYKLGSNPVLLLRDTVDAPIFSNPEYVSLLTGTGLNPLLQNWWMTIHPPTLFLGFASTIIPFAFAIAGLWTKEHRAWLKPALPWALFSGAILGTGILMGGAWAYEALSFGGYWAWDPVENMSLVPWLILIAGIHTNLVARTTDHSIRATYVFYLLTFVLIVYSTFLTRSGVLGETSVHAFTEMGLEWQLVSFIVIYVGLGAIMLWRQYKHIPSPEKEEAISSREFWMFIGSLVLLFSAVLITASTSLPVYNKIREFFDPSYVGQVITDPVPHFNKYQLWIAVFIGLLSGGSQYLRFREINFSKQRQKFWMHTIIALAIAAILSGITAQIISLYTWQYVVLLFTGWFAVVTNIDYTIFFLRGNLKAGGSALAHIGFGLMIVGVLFSGLNKNVISHNPFLMEGLTADEDAKRNTVLLLQDSPMMMDKYEVTLMGDTMDHLTRTYRLDFKRRDGDGNVVEQFELSPNILYTKEFDKVAAANPSTRHYLGRDIFTHIAALPAEEQSFEEKRAKEDSLKYTPFTAGLGQTITYYDTTKIASVDTVLLNTYQYTVEDIARDATHPDYEPEVGDLAVGVKLRVYSADEDSSYIANPVIVLRGQVLYHFPEQINQLNTRVKLREEIFDMVYTPESTLDYQEYNVAQGESIQLGETTIQFSGYNKAPSHPNYQSQEGDIAVGAVLSATSPGATDYEAQPVFIVREGKVLNVKDEIEPLGLHMHMASLDPNTGKAKLFIAQAPPKELQAAFAVAHNSFRSDWIALQAIEFPGINFFWIGASFMMFGLTLSMYYRIRQKRLATA